MTDRQRRKQTANILLNNKAGDSRILSFKTKAPAADEAHVNSLKVFSPELSLAWAKQLWDLRNLGAPGN
jgi:hypothetical protein